MLEVEVKFRIEDPAAFESRVASLFGSTFGEPAVESDVFFRNADAGFPEAGKSLRIRRRGNELMTTFKGPLLDASTKTREELELPLATCGDVESAAANWTRFFERLGFQSAARVVKTRRRLRFRYEGREFEATLDVLKGLGTFAELETMAEESEFESARGATLALAAALGLSEPVKSSYLAMALAAQTSGEVEEER